MAVQKKLTAQELMNQTDKELDVVQQERNLEDSKVALVRAIEDKEKELRNHKDAEDARVLLFVTSAGDNPNILLDKGKEAAIKEDLASLRRILKERFTK